MKKLKKDLQTLSKEIKALTKKLERLLKGADSSGKKAAAKKKVAAGKKQAAKKTTLKATAFDTIVAIISRSRNGVNTSQLKSKTGFDDKKIANIIYKAKNRGMIKSISKGIYKRA